MAVDTYRIVEDNYRICTSTTRPVSPSEGTMIYETDTDRLLVYSDSAWKLVAVPGAAPSLFSGSTTIATTGISGNAALTGVVSGGHDASRFSISGGIVTVAAGGGGRYRVDFHAGFGSSNAGTARAARIDASVVGGITNVAPAFQNTSGYGAGAGTFAIVALSAGETLTPTARQDSGGNLAVTCHIGLTLVGTP